MVPRWSARRMAALGGALMLTLGAFAVAATPAATALAASCQPASSAGKVKKDAANRHDPNELTADQFAAQEKSTVHGARQPTELRPPSAHSPPRITIPVVVHVIQEDCTRAGGNIPDSMITQPDRGAERLYAGLGRRRRDRRSSSPCSRSTA